MPSGGEPGLRRSTQNRFSACLLRHLAAGGCLTPKRESTCSEPAFACGKGMESKQSKPGGKCARGRVETTWFEGGGLWEGGKGGCLCFGFYPHDESARQWLGEVDLKVGEDRTGSLLFPKEGEVPCCERDGTCKCLSEEGGKYYGIRFMYLNWHYASACNRWTIHFLSWFGTEMKRVHNWISE